MLKCDLTTFPKISIFWFQIKSFSGLWHERKPKLQVILVNFVTIKQRWYILWAACRYPMYFLTLSQVRRHEKWFWDRHQGGCCFPWKGGHSINLSRISLFFYIKVIDSFIVAHFLCMYLNVTKLRLMNPV